MLTSEKKRGEQESESRSEEIIFVYILARLVSFIRQIYRCVLHFQYFRNEGRKKTHTTHIHHVYLIFRFVFRFIHSLFSSKYIHHLYYDSISLCCAVKSYSFASYTRLIASYVVCYFNI